MIDIDFFKAYNDHYGHLAGDECLRKLASCMSEICRRHTDLFARYGGEEFVMLFPETDCGGAICLAKQAQEKVNSLGIPHASSQVADCVTLSMGVATIIPTDNQTHLDLINSADELLYDAKRRGRNQIQERERVA
jgi:diguanylate cyclase (GGDEF)-like protein